MINLSARQYKLLNHLLKLKSFHFDEARKFNQTTLGSLIHRGYLKYDSKTNKFSVSAKGYDSIAEYAKIEILRKMQDGALSHYFKTDYNKITTKLHVMRKIA